MDKLKTLKEIDENFLQNRGHHVLCPEAFKLLKKEAINWIKEGDLKMPVISWIREFFNLKREDL